MLVLGITDGITCGAALVRDGAVLAATNEERHTRQKMAYGFPRLSIAEVLRVGGVSSVQELDLVTCATRDNYFYDGIRPFDGWFARDKGALRDAIFASASRFSGLVERAPLLERLYYSTRTPVFKRRRNAIRHILRDEFGIAAPVEFVDHHLAHAASAYFTSGFEDATVVSMDGGGDRASSHIYVVRNGSFERVAYTSAYNSLANYYAYVTHICGFKAQKHEGKITGLAAHGDPIYAELLDGMITFRDGRIRNDGGRVFLAAARQLERRLPAGWRMEDLAASIQHHAERVATTYIRHHIYGRRPKDVALAGGLFANVRINQEVANIEGVRRVFVHPGMTDCGLAVGAALTPCIRGRPEPTAPWPKEVIRDVYLGPGYSAREIEDALEREGLSYDAPPRLEAEIASLIAQGYVVARFDGRMEYGPRALGNRSILYQPDDPSVNDWLNKHLKRTEFMPFAPSTLWESADAAYVDPAPVLDSARFMTVTRDCTATMKRTCRGVVHLDGTARPQLVRKEDNPSYYRIIKEFEKLTGVASVINTSFNMHEEPIVCSPEDAIRAFTEGHLDYLAIGNFLVPSPYAVDHPVRPMARMAATI